MAPGVGIGTTVIKIMKTYFRQRTGFYLSCVPVFRPLDLSSRTFFFNLRPLHFITVQHHLNLLHVYTIAPCRLNR